MKSTLLLLLLPLLLIVEENEVGFTFEINWSNHTQIFDYLAKMENFLVLNPTIYRIELVHGNDDEFIIRYDEYLSHFPAITNTARAHYKLLRNNGIGPHEMKSEHSTCFLGGHFCLPTTATVVITATESPGTSYDEVITYNCPWIMTPFCLKEILYQRMAIMNGLEESFKIKQHC